MGAITLLDCTLRDGGYYNDWDFGPDLIGEYLKAVSVLPVDVVEVGFRQFPDKGGRFKGGCAYCTDDFVRALQVKELGPDVAVMINGSDLIKFRGTPGEGIDVLFRPAAESPVDLVRMACHVPQLSEALPAIHRLHDLGYRTTVNLMQIAGLSRAQLTDLSRQCGDAPLDIVYFADSLGSMTNHDVDETVDALRTHWEGPLGFHAHNNMEWGLANCLRVLDLDVTWIDATVLGMGRGAGNVRLEYLAIELERKLGRKINYSPLLKLLDTSFRPMQQEYQWGPNPFYYLAGMHGIHPTYVQNMLQDARFGAEDLLAAIHHLQTADSRHYKLTTLEAARNLFTGGPGGAWEPETVLKDKEVLVLGSGPGVAKHRAALERFILRKKPFVLALNTLTQVSPDLIDARVACHPIRLMADCEEHTRLPQPLITPFSKLPEDVKDVLADKSVLDFGLETMADMFQFFKRHCIVPNSLVISYTLAILTSGHASRALLAGFEGYGVDDPRTVEMQDLLALYLAHPDSIELLAVTPTSYGLRESSIYAL